MSDERDAGSEIEDMGPGDVPEPGPAEPELVHEASDSREGGEHLDKHGVKQSTRETVAKAVGIAVELGSILGGQAGDIVGAERAVAEAETEELVDRVDGEG